MARITLVGGKGKNLGGIGTEAEAARAYDAAIRKYYPNEKPHRWKGYNFAAADGEAGSDDGDDTRSTRSAASAAAPQRREQQQRRGRRRSRGGGLGGYPPLFLPLYRRAGQEAADAGGA